MLGFVTLGIQSWKVSLSSQGAHSLEEREAHTNINNTIHQSLLGGDPEHVRGGGRGEQGALVRR